MAVRRIIVLVESQYQELELWYPLLRLREAGIEAKLVGINVEETFYGRHGFPARAEMAISLINARDFDGVIIPGGFAPDYLRRLPVVLNLVREFYQGGKLVAAISRGPWVLVSADIVRGKRIAGLVSIKDDVNNAGGDFTTTSYGRWKYYYRSRSRLSSFLYGRSPVFFCGRINFVWIDLLLMVG